MKKSVYTLLACCLLSLLLGQAIAHPATYGDRQLPETHKTLISDLRQIQGLLEKINRLIVSATTHQRPDDAITFDIERLQSDVDSIQQGIDEALAHQPALPAPVTPLLGDYTA